MQRIQTLSIMTAVATLIATAPALAAGELADSPSVDAAPVAGQAARPMPTPDASVTRTGESPAGPGEYVVQPGDTLSAIAERELGDPGKWQLIARANGLDDPLALRAGQRLTIPKDVASRQRSKL